MSARQLMLVEPGGRGGVFQHTLRVAEEAAAAGWKVEVHTARDPEVRVLTGVDICRCVGWYRDKPPAIRRVLVALECVGLSAGHWRRRAAASSVVHFEGNFKPGLVLTFLLIVRAAHIGRPLVFTPHNTFVRDGSRIANWLLSLSFRLPTRVIVFSERDRTKLRERGIDAVVVQLEHYVPRPSASAVSMWRDRWEHKPTALLQGQIRRDKRPEFFAEVARQLHGWTAAIVGEDKGGLTTLPTDLPRNLKVFEGYVDLEAFVAAIAAADVVVIPYAIGSTSGPVHVARHLGIPSVVSAVGGVGEGATVELESDDPMTWASAIVAARAADKPPRISEGQHMPIYEAELAKTS